MHGMDYNAITRNSVFEESLTFSFKKKKLGNYSCPNYKFLFQRQIKNQGK